MQDLLTHRSLASLKTVAVTVSILALLALNAFAQRGRGTVLGTVTDSTGAVIPAATVTITNTATNAATTAITNDDGNFVAPNLNVGAYTVAATKAGFKKALRSGITLEVDQRAEINLVLETGAVTETVEVTSQASLVDTTTATFGKVIENRRVEELPVNGRNALSLVLLAPAVQSGIGPTASGFADRGTQISFIRINGSPFASNNLVVDGLSSVNAYVPDVNINPNVDSVQEFKVQTNTMSAEYGFTLGGVVNLVTKAGTNAYHGTLYEFFRNNVLDANSWANNRAARPIQPLRYNQYGGSIGGPIRLPKKVFGPLGYDGRDRSFFFYNYEGYQFVTNASGFYTMPTEAFRNGDFSKLADATGKPILIYDPATTRANPSGNGFLRDPFPGNIIPANRIDIVSKNILKFYPLPNRTPDNAFTNLNNYFGAVSNKRTLSNHTSRVDHRFSEKNNFTARYSYYKQYTDQGTSNLYPDPVVRQRFDPFRGHNVVLSDIHNFTPNLIHEFRIGVARQIFDFKVASAGDGWPQQLGLPAIVPPDTFPAVSNGLPGFQTGTVGKRGSSVWQLFDSLTWLRGNHTLKFGTELRLTQANNLQKSSPSGSFNFPTTLTDNAAPIAGNRINTGNSFATFLLGTVGSASVTTHLGESEVGKAYGFYGNDEWKIRRNLSLSLGLRYDYQQQPYERRCGTSMFNPFVTNSANGLKGATQYACVDYGRTFSETDKNDFAPRVGFSWDVRGNQKTVVRGGYGIFYNRAMLRTLDDFILTSQTVAIDTNTALAEPLLTSLKFPAVLGSDDPRVKQLGIREAGFIRRLSNDFRIPESYQASLGFEHELARGFKVEVNYVFNRGLHLWREINANAPRLPAGVSDFAAFLTSRDFDNRRDSSGNRPITATGNSDFVRFNRSTTPTQTIKEGDKTIVVFGLNNPSTSNATSGIRSALAVLRPFRPDPNLTQIEELQARGNSNYHGISFEATRRLTERGFIRISYTLSRLMDDGVVNTSSPLVAGDFRREYGLSLLDARHRIAFSGYYQTPKAIGGVTLAGTLNFASARPFNIGANGNDRNLDDVNNDRPNFSGDLDSIQWRKLESPLNQSLAEAFSLPTIGTVGNLPRNAGLGPASYTLNLRLSRRFQLAENRKLEFQVEAFNPLNSTVFSFGAEFVDFTPSSLADFLVPQRTVKPRTMRIGLKLEF